MPKILLTGPPGIGKTTVIRKVLDRLKLPVGGFYTAEIRERGKRVGFKIIGLNGEEDVMAHVDFPGPRVNKYGVNVAAFDRVGPSALDEAVRTGRLVIMDEIGMMELLSVAFQQRVIAVLDADTDVLGVIKQHSNPFTDKIRAREDVEIMTVTQKNRDRLPEEVAARFAGYDREKNSMLKKTGITNNRHGLS